MPEILFVHGALVRDGAWWWRQVADLVDQAVGVRSTAVALPSCGETDAAAGTTGLAEDAAALHRELDRVGSGALVVGHSYGGTVIAEGADHPAAEQLLYISSYLPDVGMAQGAILSGEADPVSVDAVDDGTVRLDGYDAASFGSRFLQDVPDEATWSGAWDRVTSQGAGAFSTPTTRAAWTGKPSTYLVCAEDGSTSVALQRFHAARATRSTELATGHHPFLSQPALVVAEVLEILERMR